MNKIQHRLVILQTHPIQYYAPLYAALAERGVLDVHVVYLTDAGARQHHDVAFGKQFEWDIPLLDGYAHTVLQPGTAIQSRSFLQRNDPALPAVLEQLCPDWILVYGYSNFFIWRALGWAARRNVRVAYTSDSNIHDERFGLSSILKQCVLRLFFRQVDACLATSEANEAYLQKYGVRPVRIDRMPFAIDVARFQSGMPAADAKRPYDFVWAGKLEGRKRPQDYLSALSQIAPRVGRPIRACVVGDGPLRAALVTQAQQLPDSCQVEFMGFVNQKAMPAVLQSADVLVFTSSREPYGLIATEAAAAGAALIVADTIGCVGNTVLARPGVNSRVYRAGDVDALAKEMELLICDSARLARMQAASRSIASEHDLQAAAQVIESALLRDCCSGEGAHG